MHLSVVVLAWNQLPHTRRCIAAIRQNTHIDYELIVVDNGSASEAREFASTSADVTVCLDENVGFAKGMNAGLAVARGDYIAFVNNDTEVPPAWAESLIDAVAAPNVGMAIPAVTAAGNARTVRERPGTKLTLLHPFESPPSGVLCMLPTALARQLGGWEEGYLMASGEDADLAFKIWTNDLDIVFDERILVQHEGKVTAVLLRDWRRIWRENGKKFLEKWADPSIEVPYAGSCSRERYSRNRRIAAASAATLRDLAEARERAQFLRRAGRPFAPYIDALTRRRQRSRA
jgi:GT2 family glycosyltransferase